MRSWVSNERITDDDNEIVRNAVLSEKIFDDPSLPSRKPELDPWKTASDLTDLPQMVFSLQITRVMPSKIRTLSTVVSNEDHHCVHPQGMHERSQPPLQGFAYIWHCVEATHRVTFFANTTFLFPQY